MTDKELIFVISVFFFLLQFAYNVWSKSQTQKLIETSAADTKAIIDAISAGISSFNPHLETTRRIFGIVKDIQAIHNVRDEDGRPMCYIPKEIIETQREIASVMHIVSSNHANTLKLLEKMDGHIETKLINQEKVVNKINNKLNGSISLQREILKNVKENK